MKYVLIGNSAAAIGAIEGIRSVDKEGEITVLTREKYFTYSRPLISYLLCGKTDLERMKYRNESFYADNKAAVEYSAEAVDINSENNTVKVSDGREFSYDKLLIATGGKPFIPPAKGLDKVKFHTFTTLDDALNLEKELSLDKRVLIVGAGLIGLKCAEGIFGRVKEITVADLSYKVLSSVLDDKAAKKVQAYLEDKGLKFALGDKITEYGKNYAVTEGGKKIEFDVLVIAVGVAPETALAGKAGCEISRGIVCDDSGKTTVENIYAAGDCSLSHDVSCGKTRVLALLPNAYMQGHAAGVTMAGGSEKFDKAVPMNSMGVLGYHLITCGVYEGDFYEKEDGKNYKKLFYKDGVLVGYIMTGEVDRAGIYTSLIRNRTPLNSIDFELICEKPALMAYAKQDRARQLGGMV